jgi:sulfur-oxidizing protein SoxZ
MGNPMKIRASAKDGQTEVKVLMNHEMETGLRKDSSGAPIPAHYITDVVTKLNGKTVMQAQWGQSVSKNPFMAFKVKGGAPGDKVSITWTDNKGDSRTDETTVA